MTPVRRTRRDENAERTREALLEHARVELTERGYAATSIDAIAAAARMTKGAVYHHFKNKRELFAAVYESLARELDVTIAARMDAATDPMSRVLAGIDGFLDGADDPSVHAIMLRDGMAVLAGQCRVIDDRYFLDRLTRELIHFRGDDDLTPHLARIVLAALIEAGQILAESDDLDRTRAELRQALVLLLASLARS